VFFVFFVADWFFVAGPNQWNKEISLPEKFNFFSIDFVALNFSSSNKNQYAHRLDGFDKDWIYTGKQRSATFTNLNPALTLFTRRPVTTMASGNEQGITLVIHIQPSWWKTWWSKSLAALMTVVTSIGIYKFRVRRIQQQNLTLKNWWRNARWNFRLPMKNFSRGKDEIQDSEWWTGQTAWRIGHPKWGPRWVKKTAARFVYSEHPEKSEVNQPNYLRTWISKKASHPPNRTRSKSSTKSCKLISLPRRIGSISKKAFTDVLPQFLWELTVSLPRHYRLRASFISIDKVKPFK